MKGLELCERFFYEEGETLFRNQFRKYYDRLAFGLVGDGSECYGYDDDLSRDHDWGPGFCLWLAREDFNRFGAEASEIYNRLPASFLGHPPRKTSSWGANRIGVFEISAFYRSFIGNFQPPESLDQWLALPDNALAAATNGKVFQDPKGEFSRIRDALLVYYPEDVRRKKIAARCMSAGREGQYNFPRSLRRYEFYAARYAEMKFCSDALSLVFLLNKRYAPFYKWTHRAAKDLPVLGAFFHREISNLLEAREGGLKIERIEAMSRALIEEIQRQGLSDCGSDYLPDHGPVVLQTVSDQELRERSVWVG